VVQRGKAAELREERERERERDRINGEREKRRVHLFRD
jgi:hypothetical protein